jgi:hypothetical protein
VFRATGRFGRIARIDLARGIPVNEEFYPAKRAASRCLRRMSQCLGGKASESAAMQTAGKKLLTNGQAVGLLQVSRPPMENHGMRRFTSCSVASAFVCGLGILFARHVIAEPVPAPKPKRKPAVWKILDPHIGDKYRDSSNVSAIGTAAEANHSYTLKVVNPFRVLNQKSGRSLASRTWGITVHPPRALGDKWPRGILTVELWVDGVLQSSTSIETVK